MSRYGGRSFLKLPRLRWYEIFSRKIKLNNYYMNTLNLKGRWNEVKGKLKQKYGELTDDDLAFADGKEDELLGRLQQKLGKEKEEIRKMIEEL